MLTLWPHIQGTDGFFISRMKKGRKPFDRSQIHDAGGAGRLVPGAGEPAFRARQVFQWLYRGAVSFDEMTDLPRSCGRSWRSTVFLQLPRWPESRSPPRMAPSNTCGGCQTETASRRF